MKISVKNILLLVTILKTDGPTNHSNIYIKDIFYIYTEQKKCDFIQICTYIKFGMIVVKITEIDY